MTLFAGIPTARDETGHRFVEAIRQAAARGLRHSPECFKKGERACHELLYRRVPWRELSIDGCPWCDFIKKETGTE